MELSNIRLLVKDFDTCFKFYSEQLGLKVTWGNWVVIMPALTLE
jgi:catechol 2,3-dioxygenase-like lactoylglutathione lyase family enzyme